ncbi:MAG: response regulator [Opitutaceae bacterium]|nr:response regulator [Opitutaceae bacterium]
MAKILIADDSTVCRTVLSILLTNQGHEVKQAGDGKEAIGYLKREGFDLILLDHDMPHASGMEVLRRVREHSEIPVIVVSGTVTPELSQEYAALRVGRIYGKPVNPVVLRDAIASLLASATVEAVAEMPDKERTFDKEIARVKDFPATLTLLGSRETPFTAIIKRIVGDAPLVEIVLPESGGGELLAKVRHDRVIVIPSAADLSDAAQAALEKYVSKPRARVILCVTSSIQLLEDRGFSQTLLMRFGTRCLEIPEEVWRPQASGQVSKGG